MQLEGKCSSQHQHCTRRETFLTSASEDDLTTLFLYQLEENSHVSVISL